MNKRGILIVSVGTSHKDAREKSIEIIEHLVRTKFPECSIQVAFTSDSIRKKIFQQTGIVIDNVESAINRFYSNGILDIIIQPIHLISGYDYEEVMKILLKYKKLNFIIGKPLLSNHQDLDRIINILKKRYDSLPRSEVLVLMGHGTSHPANIIYEQIQQRLNQLGLSRFYVGTLSAKPSLSDVMLLLKEVKVQKVLLVPLMLVAGNHAKEDMVGQKSDSWKNRLEREGFFVQYELKGLGEYQEIQEVYVKRIEESMNLLDK